MENTNSGNDLKLSQGRSPAYPFIPLGKAIERVNLVYEGGVGRNSYPPGTFYKLWGVGAKSSSARQTMAALNHFGLVEYDGRGNDRKVRLSEIALKIAQDKRPNSTEREAAIRSAALHPPIHSKLFEKFPPPMPDDVFIQHFLVSDAGYNDSAVDALIREYKSTLEFAQLTEPANMPNSDGNTDEKLTDDDPSDTEDTGGISVGGFVNWESDGQIQWREPWKVVGIDEDPKGSQFLKVQGTGEYLGQDGWIPIEEAIVDEERNPALKPKEFSPPVKKPKVEEVEDHNPSKFFKDVNTLDEGEATFIWPREISAESYEDLKFWMDGLMRKAKRRAGLKDGEE